MTLPAAYPKGHEPRVLQANINNFNFAPTVGELKRDLIKALRQAFNKCVPAAKGKTAKAKFLTGSASMCSFKD